MESEVEEVKQDKEVEVVEEGVESELKEEGQRVMVRMFALNDLS